MVYSISEPSAADQFCGASDECRQAPHVSGIFFIFQMWHLQDTFEYHPKPALCLSTEYTYYLPLTPVGLWEIDVTFYFRGEARAQCWCDFCQEKEGTWQASWTEKYTMSNSNTKKIGRFHYLMEVKTILKSWFCLKVAFISAAYNKVA